MAGFAGKFFLIGSLLSLGALRPDRECEAMNALSHKASIKVPTIFPISLKKKWESEKMGCEKFWNYVWNYLFVVPDLPYDIANLRELGSIMVL